MRVRGRGRGRGRLRVREGGSPLRGCYYNPSLSLTQITTLTLILALIIPLTPGPDYNPNPSPNYTPNPNRWTEHYKECPNIEIKKVRARAGAGS